MFAIIGIVVVFGCVVAGYLTEHGNMLVLLQPSELVMIGGAAIGTVLIANPLHILKSIAAGIGGVFGASKFGKQRYLQTLKMMFDLLNKARREGLMALESDVEEPDKSPILSTRPEFLKHHHIRDFVCDSLRMAITGVDAFELDQMLDLDMEVHHHDASQPTAALSSMADSLPGLGIVAAVLGVVITMGSLGGPPEEIGHKVAAALVGTFLGILLCYGLVGPIAASMTKIAEDEHQLQRAIHEMNVFDKLKSHIEMTITAEGLRIELMEGVNGTFFDSGSPRLNDDGRELLVKLAQELGQLPNTLSIEGHTDSKPYARSANFGNWELSSDRANAARRLMQASGIGANQVTQVRGFADQRLRKPDDPLDPSNRRVSLIVQYTAKNNDDDAKRSTTGEGKAGEKSSTAPPSNPAKKE